MHGLQFLGQRGDSCCHLRAILGRNVPVEGDHLVDDGTAIVGVGADLGGEIEGFAHVPRLESLVRSDKRELTDLSCSLDGDSRRLGHVEWECHSSPP